jgi:putative phosphoesterase
MAIGIISDIHGNYEALKAVLAELDRMEIAEVYSLGDVVGYHTQINECCEELISRKIPNIMGNHDWYLAGGGFCSRSNSVNEFLAYQRRVIHQDNLNWLRASPPQRVVGEIHMVHGGWSNPIDEYLSDPQAEYFERVVGRIFMSGHTHVQTVRHFGEKVYCNPGSVGQPRDGDPRSAFAVFDGEFTLHRVAYDMQVVFDLMEAAGFNDYYYGGLVTGASNLTRLPGRS